MITSLASLKSILLDKVCEVKFARRNLKPGRPLTRRMLCTNNVQLLNSFEGRTILNTLESDQTFWVYITEKIAPMSAGD